MRAKYFVIITVVALGLSGCMARGSIKAPLNPVGSSKNIEKGAAKVNFYRSSDHFGVLQFGDYFMIVDYDEEYHFENPGADYDTDKVMLANRSNYMTREFTPGVHTFSFRGQSEQVANLQAGKEYFLAVTFSLGGIAGLEFRTEQEFIEETRDDQQIEFVGTCNFWTGCGYKELED